MDIARVLGSLSKLLTDLLTERNNVLKILGSYKGEEPKRRQRNIRRERKCRVLLKLPVEILENRTEGSESRELKQSKVLSRSFQHSRLFAFPF